MDAVEISSILLGFSRNDAIFMIGIFQHVPSMMESKPYLNIGAPANWWSQI